MKQDLMTVLTQASSSWLLKSAQALAILALGLILAFLLRKLSRTLFSKFAPRQSRLGRYVSSTTLMQYSELLSRCVFWATLVTFVAFSVQAFGIDVLGGWMENLATLVPRLLSAAGLVIAGLVLSQAIRSLILSSASTFAIAESNKLANFAYFAGVGATMLVALKQVGVEVEFLTSGVLLILAGLLLATAISFGFGSAPLVTNLLASFYLRKVVKVGASIKTDQVEGEVVGLTGTGFIVRSGDKTYMVPAKSLSEAVVEVNPS